MFITAQPQVQSDNFWREKKVWYTFQESFQLMEIVSVSWCVEKVMEPMGKLREKSISVQKVNYWSDIYE